MEIEALNFIATCRWIQGLILFDFTINHRPGNTMGKTDYISRHPALEAQKMDDYEEKFVVNQIKEINQLIGTG